MAHGPRWWFAVWIVWALLWATPVASMLRASMAGQMLVQMPALTLLGVLMGRALWVRSPAVRKVATQLRWAALILATATLGIWMIPRLLDLAVQSAWVECIKAVSLTVFGGVPLSWAWRAFGPVMRGLIHVEAVATVFRLAWLYLDSPVRLCTQYRYDDQQLVGGALAAIGVLYLLWLIYLGVTGGRCTQTPSTSL